MVQVVLCREGKSFPSTHLRFIGWVSANKTDKRQINKRKTNKSLLVHALHTYMGAVSDE